MTEIETHGLRGVLPRACLPAGEAVATPPTVCASRGSEAFYSLSPSICADTHFGVPITERGGDAAIPAPISAFVDAWISPRPKVSAPRDFTFKAVIGDPSW